MLGSLQIRPVSFCKLDHISFKRSCVSVFKQPAAALLVARTVFLGFLGVSTFAIQPAVSSRVPTEFSTKLKASGPRSTAFGTMAWSCTSDSNQGLITNLRQAGLIKSNVVENAMRAIDRGHYVPEKWKDEAYADSPVPIGYGATISAPHMHAMCLELLRDNLKPGSSVLDVGSGSGYLTACMAAMVAPNGKVYGVEHIPELVEASKRSIAREDAKISGLLEVRTTDGRQGYPDKAPYDAIHVGAAAAQIPQALIDQLKVGGRMVIPVGPDGGNQELYLVEKRAEDKIEKQVVCGVRYVPLTDAKKQAPIQRDEGVPYAI